MGSYPDTDVDPLFFFGIDSLDISPYTSSNSSCIKETRRMKNINKGIFFRFNTSSQRFNYWKRMADSKASRNLDRVGEIEFATFVRE